MPKSKHRRKKGGRKKRMIVPVTLETRDKARDFPGVAEPVPSWPVRLRQQMPVIESVVLVFPLIAGTWIGGGLRPEHPEAFAAILAVWASIYHLAAEGDTERSRARVALLWAIGAAGLILFMAVLPGWTELGLLLGASLLSFWLRRARAKTAPLRAASAVGWAVVMSVLGVLGVHAQAQQAIAPAWAIVGFCPGLVLAASRVAADASRIEIAGWDRVIEHERQDGTSVERPGGVARLYSLLLFLGPGIALVIVPTAVLPGSFIILALALAPAPRLATAFLEQSLPDDEIAFRTLLLGALTAVLTLIAGAAP